MSIVSRFDRRFAQLAQEGRAALVTFVTAGDPDLATSLAILKGLPAAGADIIELGMPFSDPMAEGPPIQASSKRALDAGHKMADTLAMVATFRESDKDTPIVLMGYYNPIYSMGVERFLKAARAAGVDGLIVVDVPPEADGELCLPALAKGIAFIRLATPTTDERRLPRVLSNTTGFLYYVSIAGITGTATPDIAKVSAALARLKAATNLPICVGFGVKTPEQASAIARIADGVVVGSALVEEVRASLENGKASSSTASRVHALVARLAEGIRSARKAAAA